MTRWLVARLKVELEKQCASKNTLDLGLGIAAAHHLILVETSSMFHPTEAVGLPGCRHCMPCCTHGMHACDGNRLNNL
jgi:hypothetical protein